MFIVYLSCCIILCKYVYLSQYYRQARIKALTIVYPELASEYAEGGVGRFHYPRPISEPPSPTSSRHTTPAASIHGSDDENDEVDDEKEVSNLKYHINGVSNSIPR